MREEIMNIAEALKILRQHNAWRRGEDETIEMVEPKLIGDAIDVAIAALAQPSQEPVAWMTEDGRVSMDGTKNCMPRASAENFNIPLYTHPRPDMVKQSTDQRDMSKSGAEIDTLRDAASMTVARLQDAAKDGDTEYAHMYADKLLCDLLIELGYEDVVTAYNEIKKWYA